MYVTALNTNELLLLVSIGSLSPRHLQTWRDVTVIMDTRKYFTQGPWNISDGDSLSLVVISRAVNG